MGTWQDTIHPDRAENSIATVAWCRIHVQVAIRRLQPDRAPDTAEKYLHRHERSYNELRASNCCRADRGRFDLCQCFCADAAAVSTSGNTTAAETDPACAVINATAGTTTPPPAQTTPPRPAQPPATQPSPEAKAPSATEVFFPIYPTAQFLASYDAGRGQRYYIYGATALFADVVTFYRTQLDEKGTLVFKEPPTHMFEIGRFREESMAFPPGVTVKDWAWGGSQGYVNPKPKGSPPRFPTIVMIVPPQPQGSGR